MGPLSQQQVVAGEVDGTLPGSVDPVDGGTLHWVLSRIVEQLAMWSAAPRAFGRW